MPRTLTERTAVIRKLLDQHGFKLTHTQARPLLEAAGVEIAAQAPRRTSEDSRWDEEWDQYEVNYDDADLLDSTVETVRKALKVTKAQAQALHGAQLVRYAWKEERNHFDCSKVNYAKQLESAAPSPSARPAGSKNTKAQTAAAQAKVIKTWKKGGKGRKQCPACNIYVAACSGECACGHKFGQAVQSAPNQLPPPKYGPNPAVLKSKASQSNTSAEVQALVYVEKHGGVSQVRAKIDKQLVKVEDLKAKLVKAEEDLAKMSESVELVEELHQRVKAAA